MDNDLRAEFLNLNVHHLGNLLKANSDAVSLGWSLKVCTSNKRPDDADFAGP